ncbi:MAG TPA: hypothetical protein VGR73_16585 [Bryobacteraceae bacterium]|nr:hypothetical protein [Bryobacteraceae bacterium]
MLHCSRLIPKAVVANASPALLLVCAAVMLCEVATAQLITGNNASVGNGPIQTNDFGGGGVLVNSFLPTGSFDSNNGRGVEVVGNNIYYTELSEVFGPTDSIRIAPFNNGAGGADIGALPNPRPGFGIQDLSYSNGVLYAMTGYFSGEGLVVYGLDIATGVVVRGPVTIAAPASSTSDGFVVLPNGNFFINDTDSSCYYNQYNSTTGALISGTTIVVPGAGRCTGVDTDGTYLYFQTDFIGYTKTTMSGVLVAHVYAANDAVEDISLIHPIDYFVNGHRLVGWELTNVLFVATKVVPQLSQLLGDRSQRITVASRSSWWGLKEGTFSSSNPTAFSSCNELRPNGTSRDVPLKPLEICGPGRAWQVGLAAVQVPNFTDQEVLDIVGLLWPNKTLGAVLTEAAQLAGFDPASGTGAAIVASTGDLRKSWLLRHPVVGLTLVERNVTAECIETSSSFCYGTGWLQTKDFAPTRDAAMRSISDLAAIFGAVSP